MSPKDFYDRAVEHLDKGVDAQYNQGNQKVANQHYEKAADLFDRGGHNENAADTRTLIEKGENDG